MERGLIGDIIQRFEKRGFVLVGLKLMTPSKERTCSVCVACFFFFFFFFF